MSLREEVLDAVEREWRPFCEECGVEWNGEKNDAWCPFHDDRGSSRRGFSSSVSEKTGRHHFKCFSPKCKAHEGGNGIDLYMLARNLAFKDALRELAERYRLNGHAEEKKVAEHFYTDEEGNLLFSVERWESEIGKRFLQKRADGKYGLTWEEGGEKKGVRKVPYRLHRWFLGKWVVLVEGEKCVHALEELGIPATTTPGGCSAWDAQYAEYFRDMSLVGCPDNDRGGEAYIDAALEDCHGVATKARKLVLPDLPPKGDVVDWIAAGGTKEAFLALLQDVPDYEVVEAPQEQEDAVPGLDEILPARPSCFLRQYVEYAEKYTDAPPLFHIGVGYAILSAAMGTNVHGEWWAGRTYPNIYALLVGSSATTRKTTAMNMGKYVLERAYPDAIWPSEWSFEGFLDLLTTRPQGMLFLREFSSLLKIFTRSYGEGAKPFLVDLFDCPSRIEKKLVSKEIVIESPCPVILGGTDDVWLSEALGETGVRGGLLSRLLLFPATRHDKVKWMGIAPRLDPEEVGYLADFLRNLRTTRGIFRMDGESERLWNGWTQGHEEVIDSPLAHPDAASALGRMHLYALKIAGLNAVASRESTMIEEADMVPALKLVTFCRHHTLRFLEELSTDRDSRKLIALRKLIRERPGITQRDAMRALHVKKDEFEQLLETLIGSGLVTQQDGPRGQSYLEAT